MRKIIPAIDFTDLRKIQEIASLADMEEVGGFKIGAIPALYHGLPALMKGFGSQKPVIYDHQKLGNDVPHITVAQIELVAKAGCSGIIIFPFAGLTVLEVAIETALKRGLTPIVGGLMTHEKFLAGDGGFIQGVTVTTIYNASYELGVRNFVVPSNLANFTEWMKSRFLDIVLWSPGFIKQGGFPDKMSFAAGTTPLRAIVGRQVYESDFPRACIKSLWNQFHNSGGRE